MKVILCIYTITAIAWAILLWFGDWFVTLLLSIPFALIIPAEFIIAIFYAVRKIRRKSKWRERLPALMPLAMVVVCIALIFLPLMDWKLKVEHYLFSRQRLKAIEEILPNMQGPGLVKLPHRWLSEDGTAYVFNKNKDCLLVGFYFSRGMLCPSWIVLFSAQDRPPTAKDLQCGWVEVHEKLDPHWYFLRVD